jgi:hypothetical protein
MNIVDKIPTFDDDALATLRTNASRIANGGNGSRKREAESILPLIDAEVARRLEKLPLTSVRKRRRTAED